MIAKIREFFRYKCWSKRPSIEIHLENYGSGGYVKIDDHIIPVTHIAFDCSAGTLPHVTFTVIARYLDVELMGNLRDMGININAMALTFDDRDTTDEVA